MKTFHSPGRTTWTPAEWESFLERLYAKEREIWALLTEFQQVGSIGRQKELVKAVNALQRARDAADELARRQCPEAFRNHWSVLHALEARQRNEATMPRPDDGARPSQAREGRTK